MKVRLGATRIVKAHYVEVSSLSEAADKVRDFIIQYDCVAGCGSQNYGIFTGGEVIENGKTIAKVSYNGRVWDLNMKEIAA